jgi:aquaporin Z
MDDTIGNETAMHANRRGHWVEYGIEAALLGLFMVSASCFAVLLEHPASPVRAVVADAWVRRALMGLAMGGTAIAMIYSPWGQRSGAHFNPAVTLTFFRLGKIAPVDAAAYVVAQFAGGVLGIGLASVALGALVADPSVHFVATLPGARGVVVAFIAEVVITALLMTVVLTVSNRPRIARYTGLCAGACVALFITFEAPLSGMSMNPARTLASALAAQDWRALWIYFVAPPLGMGLAASLYTRRAAARVACAKLHHDNPRRCIFCEYHRGA